MKHFLFSLLLLGYFSTANVHANPVMLPADFRLSCLQWELYQYEIPTPSHHVVGYFDLQKFMLPEDFVVYFNKSNSLLLNIPLRGMPNEALHIPTFKFYEGENGGYIAVGIRDSEAGVYGIIGGFYIIGLIRVEGHYEGHTFIPKGYQKGDNITQDPELIDICEAYFPHMAGRIWPDGDTGGWFAAVLQPSSSGRGRGH